MLLLSNSQQAFGHLLNISQMLNLRELKFHFLQVICLYEMLGKQLLP